MYLFEVSASAYSTYNIVFVSYVFKRPNTTIGQVFLHSSVVDVLVKAKIHICSSTSIVQIGAAGASVLTT